MEQDIFIEFNEVHSVGELLFVDKSKLNQYRFYRRRNSWEECNFCSNSDDYHLFEGYNEHERGVINATAILYPSNHEVEWKRA